MKVLFGLTCALLSMILVLGCNQAGEPKVQKTPERKESPTNSSGAKYTIKQVMQKAEKEGGLYKKVVDGSATAEEKEQLVEMFVALSQQTPKKGTPESWHEKTTALVDAAKGVAKGQTDAMETLKKANNCMACHNAHKGGGFGGPFQKTNGAEKGDPAEKS